MPDYRRVKIPGGTYFFTLVTYRRQKIFSMPRARLILHETIEHVKNRYPFAMIAFCVLPDHIHFIWRLPVGDADYSMRIGQIKSQFSKKYHSFNNNAYKRTKSREKRRELTLWQRRFWEHLIRDEDDLNSHIDYIHYNPVKHGLVSRVREWEESSFHAYVEAGYYDLNWGEGYQVDEKDYQFGE